MARRLVKIIRTALVYHFQAHMIQVCRPLSTYQIYSLEYKKICLSLVLYHNDANLHRHKKKDKDSWRNSLPKNSLTQEDVSYLMILAILLSIKEKACNSSSTITFKMCLEKMYLKPTIQTAFQ